MSLVVVGLNHNSAPLGMLERLAINPSLVPKALHDLASREHLAEAVVLSTCNRTEVYARCTKFHPGVQDAVEFLAAQAGCATDDLSSHLYTYHDDAAVSHLFAVAAGLDSMIIGESEVLGQVREAWLVAEREGAASQSLSRLFRHAVEVGKRVRTETAIGRGAVSISTTAVSVATKLLGSLAGANVVLVGAGVMGEGMATALADAAAGEVTVANRSVERATELATRIGGRAIGLDRLSTVMARADVLLTSTGAPDFVVTVDDIRAAMVERSSSPLLIIDIAVPRDVDPAAATVPGVTVIDMGHLEEHADRVLDSRRAELPKAREIIGNELTRYREDRLAREAAPLVVALRERAEEIRLAELDRYAGRLADLDPKAREAIEAVSKGIVNKLLHEPTMRLKAASAEDHAAWRDLLTALFDL
jgi:glutamyl-tRNA reductase